jgi:Tol biopolymer transport system component
MVAFTWAGGGNQSDQLGNHDIYVKQTAETEAIRITTQPASDRKPTWSPDGRYLAFLRAARQASEPSHLLIISALGGSEREIDHDQKSIERYHAGRRLEITRLPLVTLNFSPSGSAKDIPQPQ